MKLSHGNHVMYCLNIHPGEHWDENLSAIEHFALKVKAGICPNDPFALGLRLSAQACCELEPKLKDFSLFLRQHNMYVVSINGFPYGSFHGTVIKEQVYLPDWSSPKRVAYTLRLAEILSDLLPEGETGSISTVPGYYGKEEKPSVISNLLLMVDQLARIESKTGKRIILALEPEPDCYLDRLASIVSFFKSLYAVNELAASRHLGVCLDICHSIVEFESPLFWLQELGREGIQIPKIQISAALRALNPKDPRVVFLPFADHEYLHQTRVYSEERSEKKLLQFKDLPDALTNARLDSSGEWRIHFHVPLTWIGEETPFGRITSTVNLIEDDCLMQAYFAGGKHFEVETYSYRVLPSPKLQVTDSIIAELEWLTKKLNHIREEGYPVAAISRLI